MDTTLAIMLGVGLSAACGFRVFVPMLVMSIAARAGYLELASGFEWIATWPALLAFGTATTIEILVSLIPGLQNILDAIAVPAAAVAGTIATAAMVGNLSPFLQWPIAIIAGGGTATTVELGTAAIRVPGIGTIESILEDIAAITMSILAIVIPVIIFGIAIVIVLIILLLSKKLIHAFRKPQQKNQGQTSTIDRQI